MRHQQLKESDSFDIVDPVEVAAEHAQAAAKPRPERAVPDVPASIGLMLVGIYVLLVGMFALTIATAGKAPFMLIIDFAFLAAFFTVPFLFFKLENDPSRRPSLDQFMADGMDTYTGHVTGGGALAQMFMVPALLALGRVRDEHHRAGRLMSEQDLQRLVDRFYAKVREDALIGPVFNQAVADWDEHLEKLGAFWSSVMLTSGRYKGNPMAAHLRHAGAIEPAMFDRWLALWRETALKELAPADAQAVTAKADRIAESLKLGLWFRIDAPRTAAA